MKYAVIRSGAVFTVTEADEALAAREGWIECGDGVSVGDLWDGESFSRPDAPTKVPAEVPMSQARIVLLRRGITKADVENAINTSSLTDTQKAEALIDFEYRTTMRRASALVAAIAPLLGLTEADLDAMFVEAA